MTCWMSSGNLLFLDFFFFYFDFSIASNQLSILRITPFSCQLGREGSKIYIGIGRICIGGYIDIGGIGWADCGRIFPSPKIIRICFLRDRYWRICFSFFFFFLNWFIEGELIFHSFWIYGGWRVVLYFGEIVCGLSLHFLEKSLKFRMEILSRKTLWYIFKGERS